MGITAGPDGALWFANSHGQTIGRITTGGTVKSYTDPSLIGPAGITTGPDGALWFTSGSCQGICDTSIGRISTTGKVRIYTDPTIGGPQGIAVGPDGALWFTNNANNTIGRITTGGKVSNFTGDFGSPIDIVAGPDGAMWFAIGGEIGRITTTVTPQIGKFTPASGPVGTTVTITGQNLSGATQVAFNGTPASIVSDTATTVVTTVPAGATSGPISVTTPFGTATSTKDFEVT
jgi:virginiamycin B lyase